ncbi:MAG: GyrI-like domain-containing protein [Bacillota bacterium]|nr:GyrI-like domain-containing protein [Bacillota bacterium]
MEGKIVVVKEVKAIGIVYFGNNMKGEIPELWNVFNKSYTKIKHKSSTNLYYGICDDMPDEQGRFHYTACAEVDSIEEIPEGMEVKIIPDGKYAVYTYIGELKNLGDFYNSIFSKWMIESGYEIDYRPQFELYDERFMKNGEFDIYVPIK